MERLTKLTEFLKDDTGAYSAMRLAFLGMSFNVAAVWSYLSIKNNAVYDIPGGLAGILVGFAIGKAAQSKFENQG